ncbi:GFA family protein [Mesorhizobium sp. LHD-90]|uniref:GFA family protein n=1 Tax=Mesorhizobium sp. LHD-90 TaxID=3071414 RepID=UPI0027DF33F4|nr:GFA family protein [Mesorhizobium sp. LHD-90]MDQ6436425.1 GFA family protein [Mesorhizobium sp. LHD-90]
MVPKLPLKGSCRCGRVEIRVTKPPIATAACHCRGCQKMASSAYSLTAMVPADGFEVVKGEPAVGGMHAPELQHYFCGHCMTWMFTRPAGMDFVNVRPTMLDDTSWFRPFLETFTSTKLPFAQTGAARSFAEFPAMEEIGGLVADYAAWAAGD